MNLVNNRLFQALFIIFIVCVLDLALYSNLAFRSFLLIPSALMLLSLLFFGAVSLDNCCVCGSGI